MKVKMVIERKDGDLVKQCVMMATEATRWRVCLRKTWWDCVKDDMNTFGLSREDAQDMDDCRMRIKGAIG